ncbi:MAG: tripartite tricarboxylate transporter permease [Bacillota bacterium]|nr:tripartite tricarboxylate transporter permease [Bacillota bacterium]
MIPHLLHGFQIALMPQHMLYAFLGALAGTLVGILPGLGPAGAMALLIPVTWGRDPTAAMIMLAGIYYGAMYGGSTTAILLNVPGEAASVVTTLDGYEMARRGRAGPALCIAALGSFIAGTLSVVLLMAAGPPLASFALRFGPAENFALMAFGLSTVAGLTGKSLLKGIAATVIGLMLATVGMDLPSGAPRFTLGIPKLMDGIDIVVAAIGLFAVSEVMLAYEEVVTGALERARVSRIWISMQEFMRSLGSILRATFLGFFVGAVPGAGHVTAPFIAYTVEKRIARDPDSFGRGDIRGVAAPESANNAAASGALLPLLTLGLPASTVTAVTYGALLMLGIRPSPLLFARHADMVWGLIASMYIGNVILLILNLPLVGIWVRILSVPPRWLLPIVLAVSYVGVYSVDNSPFDLVVASLLGMLGYLMRKSDFPLAPVILGLVLGGLMEQSLRQTLMITGGSLKVFTGSPIALTLFGMAAALLVGPTAFRQIRARIGRCRAGTVRGAV